METFVIVYDRYEKKYICIKTKDMFKYSYKFEEITPDTVIPRLKIIATVPSLEVGNEIIKHNYL